MTTLYKLTDRDGYTRRGDTGETLWVPGRSLTTDGGGNLCGPGFIHAYTDPLLGVFLNPIHAAIKDPLGWRCEGVITKTDHGLKVGCTSLMTIERIELPTVTWVQCIRFAILAAQEVCGVPDWCAWAESWLSGTNRNDARWSCHTALMKIKSP